MSSFRVLVLFLGPIIGTWIASHLPHFLQYFVHSHLGGLDPTITFLIAILSSVSITYMNSHKKTKQTVKSNIYIHFLKWSVYNFIKGGQLKEKLFSVFFKTSFHPSVSCEKLMKTTSFWRNGNQKWKTTNITLIPST